MKPENRMDAAIDAALGSRIVGCVVMVWLDGQPLYERAAGLADREEGRAMRTDAIFRLASVTKPVVATATLRMVDLGLIGLEDPVTDYLPWFTPALPNGQVRPILIRHLLTHISV
jgi:CubicO group peptidase (beta-lactamase class C family)